MSIETFDALLAEARAQPDRPRLLLVFAGAELPERATAAQRAAFAAGHGGALAPLMCVDKSPAELASFAALAEESRHAGPPWAILFAASLSGPAGPAELESALTRMVDAIKTGNLAAFLAFNAAGETVSVGNGQ
jgi:hypothetical protein